VANASTIVFLPQLVFFIEAEKFLRQKLGSFNFSALLTPHTDYAGEETFLNVLLALSYAECCKYKFFKILSRKQKKL
jgi:hypothetical protein